MLSKVTGQKDDTKFRPEFTGFIELISTGKGTRWSKVINDALAQQLMNIQSSKRFYMNSYLVYLLLHGKERETSIANVEFLYDQKYSVWQQYPRFHRHNKWNKDN